MGAAYSKSADSKKGIMRMHGVIDHQSAYILFVNCKENRSPVDAKTRNCYGFDRCLELEHEGILLDLYRTLFRMGVTPEKIDKWHQQRKLYKKITKKAHLLPQHLRKWAKSHEYIWIAYDESGHDTLQMAMAEAKNQKAEAETEAKGKGHGADDANITGTAKDGERSSQLLTVPPTGDSLDYPPFPKDRIWDGPDLHSRGESGDDGATTECPSSSSKDPLVPSSGKPGGSSNQGSSSSQGASSNQDQPRRNTMPTCSKPSPSEGKTLSLRERIQKSRAFTSNNPSFDPDAFLQARLAAAKTTAEKLCISARASTIPADEQTLKDFGFDKCLFDADKVTLLSIYRLLVVGMGVSSRELREWAEEGALAIGRNVAIEFQTRRRLVPEEYCQFFLMNQKSIWGLEDVVDFEAGADITMSEAVGETAGAGSGKSASGKGDVIVILDSSDEEIEAEKTGEKAEEPREKPSKASNAASASATKISESQIKPETADSTTSKPGDKAFQTKFKKANPIPYKPRNKRYFKNKGFARGPPEKYMMTRDGSVTGKRGRDSSSPETTPQPPSKKRKFTKKSSK
ncbi:hypothetical protein CkaCkLH20_07275 [Colletotrichum karsti]|uniref:Uncharacterized protein n=1 Tax=Colletotrichum karsti TaxID=1095194 RepID=A0A9P6IB87_9PEZI|nr:uncharacterized protein CkaCkLH20_07275 [Colletotrichum karsti]KAF9875455.1 hypothetical protein CkaCkLH20_07275 [Colletotrichum karsti]